MDKKTLIGYMQPQVLDSTSNTIQEGQERTENSPLKAIDLDDFLRKLDLDKSDLSEHFVDIKEFDQKYTLTQFAVINGLTDFVKILLQNGVNPNFAAKEMATRKIENIFSSNIAEIDDEKSATKANCTTIPLFLAAELGQHEILKLFKYHVQNKGRSKFETNHEENREDTRLNNHELGERISNTVNFKILKSETHENVLHCVVKQPLLAKDRRLDLQERFAQIKGSNSEKKGLTRELSGHPTEYNSRAKERIELEGVAYEYKKCLDVLLDMDKFESREDDKRWENDHQTNYPRQIESIVNDKDMDGNTALHYAVSNWPEEFVEMLLALGASASIRNKDGDIPLSQIRHATLKNFMDKECIKVKGFDQRDDKIEEDSEDEESYGKKTQTYNQYFKMNIGLCGKDDSNKMKFDYAFLAPSGGKRRHEPASSLSSSDDDIPNQAYYLPQTRSVRNRPEMDLLWEMGRSEEHRSLLAHPVIDSFLWMKWQLITNYFHRTVRLHFLFLYCVTWYLLLHFGGHNWNSILEWKNETHWVNITSSKIFCRDVESEFDDFGLNDETNQKANLSQRVTYIMFLVVVAAQIFMMIRDFMSERFDSNVQNHVVSLWMDLFNITLSIVILLCGRKMLFLVLTTLLLFYLGVELLEIIATKGTYFKEISNYVDLAMLGLIMVVLYVPQRLIWNPKIFSIFDDTPEDEMLRCGVKRSIAAIVIVLVWTRFLMLVSKLHRLKSYNFYVIIFFKVFRGYVKIMAWYGLYLMAFGLGFYVMLHDDIKKMTIGSGRLSSNSTFQDTKFDNPFLALMKTSTMFVGEFDFDDLRMKGGDVSVSMAYFFLLVFIFLMVIVLMNVLNGLAVSDTGIMIKESLIESQYSIIQTIRYFETVYLDLGQMQNFSWINQDCWPIKLFNIMPKKIFLFKSPHVHDMELSFPLKPHGIATPDIRLTLDGRPRCRRRENKTRKSRFVSWLKGGDLNYGSEEFLIKAREILIRLRAEKTNERRQERLLSEIFKMKKRGKAGNGQMQLNEVVKKIQHFENILKYAFQIKLTGNK